MILHDYHLHSEFSLDSNEKIEKICEEAVNNGVSEIVITDHYEPQLDFDMLSLKKRDQIIAEMNELYRGELVVKSGLEIGQIHRYLDEVRNMMENHHFDFIIGSIHEVEKFGSPSKFGFTDGNTVEYMDQYFADLKALAGCAEYDVLGHITFPFRYLPDESEITVNSYEEQIREVLRIVIGSNKGIELNTSGLRTKLKEPMPSLEVMKWYKDLGGTIVTVGSDGHSVRSAFSGIEEGNRVLEKAGFDNIASYTGRECKMVRFL